MVEQWFQPHYVILLAKICWKVPKLEIILNGYKMQRIFIHAQGRNAFGILVPSMCVFWLHQVAGIDRQHAEESFRARIAGGSNGPIWSS